MKPVHVWIVEDNAPDAFLMSLALRKTNLPLEFTTMTDGEHAMRNIASCNGGHLPEPVLVLLDLHLPRISGAEVLKAVIESPSVSKARLALFSSLPTLHDGIKLRPSDRYIRKSPHLNEFLGEIVNWVMESAPDGHR